MKEKENMKAKESRGRKYGRIIMEGRKKGKICKEENMRGKESREGK